MTSDLLTFRDHCRAMSTAQHTPACIERLAEWRRRKFKFQYFDVSDPGPRPECTGCVTDSDRALWTRLADEVDAYLTEPEEAGLFG